MCDARCGTFRQASACCWRIPALLLTIQLYASHQLTILMLLLGAHTPPHPAPPPPPPTETLETLGRVHFRDGIHGLVKTAHQTQLPGGDWVGLAADFSPTLEPGSPQLVGAAGDCHARRRNRGSMGQLHALCFAGQPAGCCLCTRCPAPCAPCAAVPGRMPAWLLQACPQPDACIADGDRSAAAATRPAPGHAGDHGLPAEPLAR